MVGVDGRGVADLHLGGAVGVRRVDHLRGAVRERGDEVGERQGPRAHPALRVVVVFRVRHRVGERLPPGREVSVDGRRPQVGERVVRRLSMHPVLVLRVPRRRRHRQASQRREHLCEQ